MSLKRSMCSFFVACSVFLLNVSRAGFGGGRGSGCAYSIIYVELQYVMWVFF